MNGRAPLNMHEMALRHVPFAVAVTNPHLDDNPIVFVNDAFTRLTGYSSEMAVGRNCRFLQGEDTDQASINTIREKLGVGEEFAVELLNYKADGTPFFNRVHISPLYDAEGNLQFFIGIQRALGDMTQKSLLGGGADEALREIHHRVKNHLSMVVGMIRMQARAENANSLENYTTLARRIETLQFLYQEMTGGTDDVDETDIALGAYVSRIASAIAYLDGRESIRLNLDLANVKAPIDAAAQFGLLVSELLTNAYQHAFVDKVDGLIEVRLFPLSDDTIRLQVNDDGAGLPDGMRWPDTGNLGGKIVRSLLTGLDADISVGGGANGTSLIIDVAQERLNRQRDATNGAAAKPQGQMDDRTNGRHPSAQSPSP